MYFRHGWIKIHTEHLHQLPQPPSQLSQSLFPTHPYTKSNTSLTSVITIINELRFVDYRLETGKIIKNEMTDFCSLTHKTPSLICPVHWCLSLCVCRRVWEWRVLAMAGMLGIQVIFNRRMWRMAFWRVFICRVVDDRLKINMEAKYSVGDRHCVENNVQRHFKCQLQINTWSVYFFLSLVQATKHDKWPLREQVDENYPQIFHKTLWSL